MKKSEKITIIVTAGFLIGVLIIINSFLNVRRKKSVFKMLNKCLARAEKQQGLWWGRECVSRGFERDCRLPAWIADKINSRRENDAERCVEIYKNTD